MGVDAHIRMIGPHGSYLVSHHHHRKCVLVYMSTTVLNTSISDLSCTVRIRNLLYFGLTSSLLV